MTTKKKQPKIDVADMPVSVLVGLSVVLSAVSIVIIKTLVDSLDAETLDYLRSGGPGPILIMLSSVALTLLAHEALHALFVLMFDGKLRFGIKKLYGFLPIFYTTAQNSKFSSAQMAAMCAAPVVLLTGSAIAFAFILPKAMLVAALVVSVNLIGSSGDLYLLVRLAGLSDFFTKGKVIAEGDAFLFEE